MRSPDEVAAEKREWLDEVDQRVERFAGGRNLSVHYAAELREWLVEHYGTDPRFVPALAALREYKTKVGQVEARDACRRLQSALHDEVYGQYFPWQSVPEEYLGAWRRAADQCPVCGAPTLRHYLRAYRRGRGGAWDWCSTCFAFEHFSATVDAPPEPWPLLDSVPMSVLTHPPEFLERALRLGAP